MNKLLFSFFKTKKEPLIHKGSKLLLVATFFSDPSSLTSTFTDLLVYFLHTSRCFQNIVILALIVGRIPIYLQRHFTNYAQ